MSCAPCSWNGSAMLPRHVMGALDEIGDDHVVADALAAVGARIAAHAAEVEPRDRRQRTRLPVTHSGPPRCRDTGCGHCGHAPACPRRWPTAPCPTGTPKRTIGSSGGDRLERDLVRRAGCAPAPPPRHRPASTRHLAGGDVAAAPRRHCRQSASTTILARRSIGSPLCRAAARRSAFIISSAAAAVGLANVAGRRPAAARRQADQLHAQLVEIAVAARIFASRCWAHSL